MKKKYVIPVFVPHLGCPNDCVFCNQKSISGQKKNITKEDAKKTIEYYLDNIKDKKGKKEIAFFGGSFTGIDVNVQEELLQVAYEYIKKGQVDSIRISTRPDYINREILKRLKKYKVKTIELGVQSTNDYILKRANRGHDFNDVKKASKLIRWYGFNLGHQMMVGLPESTRNDEINTAKALIKLKPKMVRIYPVLVIKGTRLEKECEEGIYEPLTVVQAVEICKQLVRMFVNKKIDVIRVGLQNTDEICEPGKEESEVIAGPFHPAFRQLVESSMWYDAIVEKIKRLNVKVKEVKVTVNPIDINNVIGHKKENVKKLKEMYEVDLIVKQDKKIKQGKSKIEITKKYNDFLEGTEDEKIKEKVTK
ncbi:MAG: radical SAM protein [Clostridia bacterium]|nr:radical SAM protein [Clostridia bacterium]